MQCNNKLLLFFTPLTVLKLKMFSWLFSVIVDNGTAARGVMLHYLARMEPPSGGSPVLCVKRCIEWFSILVVLCHSWIFLSLPTRNGNPFPAD
jgi:hypothetical protein